MTSFVSFLYRLLRTNNDIRAIRRGPRAVYRRQVRKLAYKATSRLLRSVLR